MASLRERYTVRWDDGEPVEVETTVKDLITAADTIPAGQGQNVILLETTLIYCALRRKGHQVAPYEEWILVLDHYQKLPTQVVVEGPTQPAPMPAEPLPLRVSQEPTGDHGYLTKMTTEPSSQLSSF
jgi:hypothetical protein